MNSCFFVVNVALKRCSFFSSNFLLFCAEFLGGGGELLFASCTSSKHTYPSVYLELRVPPVGSKRAVSACNAAKVCVRRRCTALPVHQNKVPLELPRARLEEHCVQN